MLDLLKSELFKLKKNLAVKIVAILVVLYMLSLMGMMLLLAFSMQGGIGGGAASLDDLGDMGGMGMMSGLIVYMFRPSATASMAIMLVDAVSWFIMLAVVITSIIVTDYQRGIMRNLVMSGKSRVKIYLAKLIVCVGVCLVMYVMITLLPFVVNWIAFGWGEISFWKCMLHVLMLVLSFASFASTLMLVASLTRHTGATIGISIALCTVFYYVGLFAGMVPSFGLNNKIVEKLAEMVAWVSECFGGNLMTVASSLLITTEQIWKVLISAVLTIAITTTIGLLAFKKRDLK